MCTVFDEYRRDLRSLTHPNSFVLVETSAFVVYHRLTVRQISASKYCICEYGGVFSRFERCVASLLCSLVSVV